MKLFLSRKSSWFLVSCLLIVGGVLIYQVGFGVAQEPQPPAKKTSKSTPADGVPAKPRVIVIVPQKGGIARNTTQPGYLESFDYADLYAKVSGYVKTQAVDIGDRVKEGQVLLEIDAPEYPEALHEAEAGVAQAEAEVVQSEAQVRTSQAEYESALAHVTLVEADLAKATSYLKFREIQFRRISALFAKKSIEARLVDEKEEQRDAAQGAENSARAAIVYAKSQAVAAKARVNSAEADLLQSKAKVQFAKSKAARAQVFVNFMKIVSPYNGVVTRRTLHVGDVVRAVEQGATVPLLTVARTDVMRVVVQVPERDVPYTNVGDPAVVEMAALAGEKFHGKVARFANSEDRLTKTMRTEIDLPNPKNRLRDGMFGRVTITVEEGTTGLTIPSSSVVTDPKTKKPSVFVVKNGKAHRTPVEIGQDDGAHTEILSGLSTDDHVVRRPAEDLANGAEVEASVATES